MTINMIVDDLNNVDFAKALADNTRQQIMAICCCRQISVNDIVAELNVAQPTVSHHLKVLSWSLLSGKENKCFTPWIKHD
jgi:predicted transcriptional regulator